MSKNPFGGIGNLGNIMKQAQAMQDRMAKIQAEVATKTVQASSGGGIVTAVANGAMELVSIKIDREVLQGDDLDILQDLVVAAANEASRKAISAGSVRTRNAIRQGSWWWRKSRHCMRLRRPAAIKGCITSWQARFRLWTGSARRTSKPRTSSIELRGAPLRRSSWPLLRPLKEKRRRSISRV